MKTISKEIEYAGESGQLDITGFPTVDEIPSLDTDSLAYLLKGAINFALQHDASGRFRAPFKAWETARDKAKSEGAEVPEKPVGKYEWRFAELVELSKGSISKALVAKAEAMLAHITENGDKPFRAKAALYSFDCPKKWDLESCVAYQRAKQAAMNDVA